MEILIVLFIIFVVIPFVGRYLLVWYLQRKAKKLFGQAFNPFGRQADEDEHSRERKAGWSSPTPHKKKVEKDVGEYVHFEEVKVEITSDQTDKEHSSERFVAEQQIVDVEWEDL